jgi:hypothetical protein
MERQLQIFDLTKHRFFEFNLGNTQELVTMQRTHDCLLKAQSLTGYLILQEARPLA